MNQIDLQQHLGGVLQKIRRERGLTQDQLAARANLHRTYISDVERGARNPSLGSLHRLAHALGTPLAKIFTHVEQSEDAGQSER